MSTKISLQTPAFPVAWLHLQTWITVFKLRANKEIKKIQLTLGNTEKAHRNIELLEQQWKAELKAHQDGSKSEPSLMRALMRSYGRVYTFIGIWKVVWGTFTWLGAWFFLKMFLTWVNSEVANKFATGNEQAGHLWAVAILISGLCASLSIHQLYTECARVGVQVRGALTGLIYRKSLKIASVKGGAGEVINFVSADVSRIVSAVTEFHYFWSAFTETILILILAAWELRLACIPVYALVMLLLPLQYYLGTRTSHYQERNSAISTSRIHLMSEILTAIKLIKFYAWERPFSKRISDIRKEELESLRMGMVIKSINYAMVFAVPVIAAVASLAWYSSMQTKDPVKVFVVLSILNTLRYPFLNLPSSVRYTTGARISVERIRQYLIQPENTPIVPLTPPEDDKDIAFNISNGNFTWEGQKLPAITGINVRHHRGKILAIIGDVGCGKSSFLASILGQIKAVEGNVEVYGNTSYVPQEAWILGNSTLRDNILFGKPYDAVRYKEVIRICGLQRDLALLVAGDQTEMAERGANLSGGQKHRVSLARAVYSDSDLILLDSPLAALDQNVGRHIFEQCFKGYLRDKMKKGVVLVTHQLQYLQQVDTIGVMKGGKIIKYGTYAELIKDSQFKEQIEHHVTALEDREAPEDASDEPIETEDTGIMPELAAREDTPVKDHLAKDIHEMADLNSLTISSKNQLTAKSLKYFNSLNEEKKRMLTEQGRLTVMEQATTTSLAEIIRRNESTIHSMADVEDDLEDQLQAARAPKLIKEDKSSESVGAMNYLHYARAGKGTAITCAIIGLFFFVHGIRITSDYWLRFWVPNALKLGSGDSIYLGVYGVFVVLFATGVFVRGIVFSNEVAKKAEEVHQTMFQRIIRAPQGFFDTTPLARILSAFSKHQTTIDDAMPDLLLQVLQYIPLALGALIIIAYVVPYQWGPVIGLLLASFMMVFLSAPAERKMKQLDAITKPPLMSHLTATLEGLFSIRAYQAQDRFDKMNIQRIDTNGEALYGMALVKSWVAFNIDIMTSVIIYTTALLVVIYRADIPTVTSATGLALSNALQLLVFLQWSVRMLGDVQAQMGSVGQVTYYGSDAVAQEAPAEIPANKPEAEWPANGVIEFRNVVLRYQVDGVDVLKKVSFKVNPREKIGLVGRTGSGKSTLLVALLRIVELAEGEILIDGINIKTLGLNDLRTCVAIIPQESILFVGTIRSNLDPFDKCTDDAIWKALDQVHLGDALRAFPAKLDTAVIENGQNFSLGQRQLFCIARAILSKTRILVLDEASSALDLATDALIQESIKTCFKDLTVLTVAHRLNTIIESDKVLVMEGGVLQEFEEPIKLLNNPNSEFAKLVAHTGPAAAEKLKNTAAAASQDRAKARKAGK